MHTHHAATGGYSGFHQTISTVGLRRPAPGLFAMSYLKYLPAVVVAGVLLTIVGHSWFVRDTAPSQFMIAVIVALVLTPVASRIKIFDWIDIRKSVEGLGDELADTKREVASVAQSLTALTAQVQINSSKQMQAQTLANITVDSTKAAVEAAMALRKGNPPTGAAIAEPHRPQLEPSDFSYEFRLRLTPIWSLDELISEITAYLRVSYAFAHFLRGGRFSGGVISDMDLLSLVGYFRESGHPLLTQEADQQEGLEYLKRLENLIAEKEKYGAVDLPESKARELMQEGRLLSAYFGGNAWGVSSGLGLLMRTVDSQRDRPPPDPPKGA